MEDYEGADWVRVSDDVPVDEDRRDRLLEAFQTHYHPGSGGSVSETALEQGDEELDGAEAGPPSVDEELREEVRRLVIAGNERRLRRGLEPLDVEAETERQLENFVGSG